MLAVLQPDQTQQLPRHSIRPAGVASHHRLHNLRLEIYYSSFHFQDLVCRTLKRLQASNLDGVEACLFSWIYAERLSVVMSRGFNGHEA